MACATLLEKNDSYLNAICDFFRETEDTKKAIDVIDISFQFIDEYVRRSPLMNSSDGRVFPLMRRLLN